MIEGPGIADQHVERELGRTRGRGTRWQYRLELHIENSARDRVVRYSDLLNFGSQLYLNAPA
jgi:hypothetical protein